MHSTQHSSACIPRCLSGLYVAQIPDSASQPIPLKDIKLTPSEKAYSIACSCGETFGDILGQFQWRNQTVYPPFVPKPFCQIVFESFFWPLSKPEKPKTIRLQVAEGKLVFKCSACGKETEIINPAIHGWDGEQGATGGYESSDQLTLFQRPNGSQVRYVAFFRYHKDIDKLAIPGKHPCDLFSSFTLVGIEESEEQVISIAEFELA
jgi:hypothetical protein